ncbi:hypothetical protein DCM91_14195 [Chitinophaga costaii]|nr:hypothetical protein DCM91_14195 [Chitinophaga costaii]
MMAILVSTIGMAANAQTTQNQHKSTCSVTSDSTKKENYVMMYKGKMMKIVDGKPSPMTEPVKLNNGAKVNTDGTVTLLNGTKIRIKENEMVTMGGKMSMYQEK